MLPAQPATQPVGAAGSCLPANCDFSQVPSQHPMAGCHAAALCILDVPRGCSHQMYIAPLSVSRPKPDASASGSLCAVCDLTLLGYTLRPCNLAARLPAGRIPARGQHLHKSAAAQQGSQHIASFLQAKHRRLRQWQPLYRVQRLAHRWLQLQQRKEQRLKLYQPLTDKLRDTAHENALADLLEMAREAKSPEVSPLYTQCSCPAC